MKNYFLITKHFKIYKMIKKSFIFLFLITILHNNLRAQKLMHSIGATMSLLTGEVATSVNSKSTLLLNQTSFCYFPRYNFIEKDNSSISVGLPIGIGIGIATNTTGNDAGISFAYDLPLVLDYNIGCKSTSENDETFGGYFGIGFGYYKVNISQSQYSDFKGATYGPLFRGGVRIGSERESWNGRGVTVGLFYKKGLESSKLSTFGFNVLLDF